MEKTSIISGNPVLIKDGEGFSEELGYLGGLTVSETVYGYVGMFKSCEKHNLVENNNFQELISIEFFVQDELILLDNIKINFVDQFGQVYFCGFRSVTI